MDAFLDNALSDSDEEVDGRRVVERPVHRQPALLPAGGGGGGGGGGQRLLGQGEDMSVELQRLKDELQRAKFQANQAGFKARDESVRAEKAMQVRLPMMIR